MPLEIEQKTNSSDSALPSAQGRAEELGRSFIRQLYEGGEADFDAIDQLVRMAAAGDEPGRSALSALYNIVIIKGLCDDFSSFGVVYCNRVLSRIIDCIRKTPQGGRLDELLDAFGFHETEELLARYERCLQVRPLSSARKKQVRKVVIPSRVTVGADIVMTTVMVHRLRRALPNAELIVVGPSHLDDIFSGLNGVRRREMWYNRHGAFGERLANWPQLYDMVRQEQANVAPAELLLFDPDTRLTQLGMMPLLPEDQTFYFPSRQSLEPEDGSSLSILVNRWLDRVLGEHDFCAPAVSLPPHHLHAARIFCEQFPARVFIVVINLGVGGDEQKSIPAPFEEELLLALLQEPDTLIILDCGSGPEEKAKVDSYLALARSRSIPTAMVEEGETGSRKIGFSSGMIGFQGGIGAIGGLIERADLFFGYDSCCQHLACALETPTVIVFAGARHTRFLNRWRPYAQEGLSTIIPIPPGTVFSAESRMLLLHEVLQASRQIRQGKRA